MAQSSKQAKYRLDNFQPRGSECPICKKDFRHGCDHSVVQAKEWLHCNYIRALMREELVNVTKT